MTRRQGLLGRKMRTCTIMNSCLCIVAVHRESSDKRQTCSMITSEATDRAFIRQACGTCPESRRTGRPGVSTLPLSLATGSMKPTCQNIILGVASAHTSNFICESLKITSAHRSLILANVRSLPSWTALTASSWKVTKLRSMPLVL